MHLRYPHRSAGRRSSPALLPLHQEVIPWEEVARGYDCAGPVRDCRGRGRRARCRRYDLILMHRHPRLCRLGEIDPIYYDTSYYAEPPSPRAGRPTPSCSRRCSKWVAPGWPRWPCAGARAWRLSGPHDGAILVQQMHYADEVNSFALPGIPHAAAEPRELRTAIRLIEPGRALCCPTLYGRVPSPAAVAHRSAG